MMTLTKAPILGTITKRTGFAKNKNTDVVEHLTEIIKRTLENGEDVLFSGFGKFCVKEKSSAAAATRISL
jgi:integration host factor subunit alpha